MKGFGFAAYGAGVAGATLYGAPSGINTISFLARPDVSWFQLWCLWLAATLVPLALSAIVWMVAEKFRSQWLPHLVFIPVAAFVYVRSMSLFLRVSGLMDHDGPAGDASGLGSLYLLLTLIVHVSAIAMAVGTNVEGQTNGS